MLAFNPSAEGKIPTCQVGRQIDGLLGVSSNRDIGASRLQGLGAPSIESEISATTCA